jgi:hypothetical protein
MAGKRGSTGENSKKAAGQARKAEAAANKKAAKDRELETAKAAEWQSGAKDNSRKYVAVQISLSSAASVLTCGTEKHQQPRQRKRRRKKLSVRH